MIRYALRCQRRHDFESWFPSAGAFDTLRTAGRLECPVCGSDIVEKAVMAPRVAAAETQAPETEKRPLTMGPTGEIEQAMAKLRDMVERESDYVGKEFAQEARRIHEGDAPERPIHGQARLDEARQLLEDGVQILPLPFRSRRNSN